MISTTAVIFNDLSVQEVQFSEVVLMRRYTEDVELALSHCGEPEQVKTYILYNVERTTLKMPYFFIFDDNIMTKLSTSSINSKVGVSTKSTRKRLHKKAGKMSSKPLETRVLRRRRGGK